MRPNMTTPVTARSRAKRAPCTVTLLVALSCSAPHPEATAEPRPNIILIYCDDLGYGDIGCFGSTAHRTPHIDRLAAHGMRLTSFYVTSGVCTPSRSSLMTGCYPRRVDMHQSDRGEWVLFPIAKKGLAPAEITIAEVLAESGYATACVGKWHLGDQPQFLPTRQGFHSYFGIPYSNDMGTRQRRPQKNPPLPLMRGEQVIEAPADQTTLTRRYTEEAVRFITENRERPFFLYLPHTFPHLPLHASESFRGKSSNGPFGDAVEEIDWSTGQILATLDELGLADNTLVVFTSDNGAARRAGGSNAPLRGFKGSTWEGGMRVACAMRWPGVIPAGTSCGKIVSTLDMLPTLAHFAGARVPADRTIDGIDVHALLTSANGSTEAPRDTFFYYFKDQLRAVRGLRWKLHLARTERRRGQERQIEAQLYDLESDVGEKNNVVDAHPEVVARLQRLAESCRRDLGHGAQGGADQRPAGIEADPKPQTMGPR